jgi:gliding motility-associated-like protein
MLRFRYYLLALRRPWIAVLLILSFLLPDQYIIAGISASPVFSPPGNPLTVTVKVVPVSFEFYTTTFVNSTYNYGLTYNGSIILVASGGTAPYTYFLEDPSTKQQDGTFSGLAPGTYKIDITDAAGQLVVKTIIVGSVYPQPSINISNIVYPSSCTSADGGFTLAGAGGTPPYQYSIDGGATFSSNGTFTGLTQGYYTFLLVKDARGFLASTGFNTPLTGQDFACHCCRMSILAVLENASSCSDKRGKIIVEGINGALIKFSIDSINYFPGSQKPLSDGGFEYEYTFTKLSPGTVHIYARDANGNTAVSAIPVIKICSISIATANTDASCHNSDGSITVSASAGTPPYSYSIDGINYQNSNVFTGLGAGIYNILVKDNNSTTSSVTDELNDNCPLMNLTVTNGSCARSNGLINAVGMNGSGPYQYSLDGTNFQNNGDFESLAAGNYTITIKDANGLTNTETISISNTVPPQIVTNATTATCNNDGTITAAGSSGLLPLQYSLDNISFQTNNIFTGLAGGTYSLVVKDSIGCTSSQVTIVPLINNLMADAGSDQTVCEGVLTTLNAVSNGATFSWTPVTGVIDPTVLHVQVSPAENIMYTLTASKGPCTAKDFVTINVKPAPHADAGQDTVICFGKDFQLQGSGGKDYSWTPGNYLSDTHIADPVVLQPLHSMTYYLVVTDAEGCSSIQNAPVYVRVTPTPKVFAGNDTSSGFNQTVQLHAADMNNSGFYQYTWTPAAGLNNPNISNPIATLSGDMLYTVSATAPGGCESSDEVRIKLFAGPSIYVPNAFTPNGDGKNDVLKSIPIGIRTFKYFAIYNRLGQKIFYSNDPGKGWDGTLNGTPQSDGGFVWMVEGIDINGKIIHREGPVLLIR